MISANNKKLISMTIWIVSIIICAVLVVFNPFIDSFEERQAQVEQIDSYIIGVYDEKIAVFAQGDSVPIEIYDVYVTTLPEKDQKSLKKGISAKGKIELRRLIEDYTS